MFVALGSNLGDRAATLRGALDTLNATPGVRVLRFSSFHETAPVGGPPGQGPFLNAVAELATAIPPAELLTRLHAIEARFGRERSVANAPRTLDLDLLLYRRERIAGPDLTVPHPRMWQRAFVLTPLGELLSASEIEALRVALAR